MSGILFFIFASCHPLTSDNWDRHSKQLLRYPVPGWFRVDPESFKILDPLDPEVCITCDWVKGCGMGTLFVLVSPWFRENVVFTCKIGSFLCSLDNLLQKKRNCFLFFWKSNFKMALIWKKSYFWPIFLIFCHQGKVTKIPSAHISLTYIHVFCSPYWLFCLTNFEKKIRIYQVWYLFGMSSIVICKPRTLNDGGEGSVQYRNRKKHCFLAAAILLFSIKLLQLGSLPESLGSSLS